MKKLLVLLLAVGMLAPALSCGNAEEKATDENHAEKTEWYDDIGTKSLEEALTIVEENGYKGAVISVYEPSEPDGRVFITEEFVEKSEQGYLTVAVNDLSIKTKFANYDGAPLVLTEEELGMICDALPSDYQRRKVETFYPYDEESGSYVIDPILVRRELEEIDRIIDDCNIEYDFVTLERYIELGYIPTLSGNIIADVLEEDDFTFDVTYNYNGNAKNVVVPKDTEQLSQAVTVYLGNVNAVTFETAHDNVCAGEGFLLNINTDSLSEFNINGFRGKYLLDFDENGFGVMNGNILVEYRGKQTAEIVVPEYVEYIADGALPSVYYVDEGEFIEDVTSVTLPENLIKAECYAFSGLSYLEKCVFEGADTVIGQGAFEGCESLNEVILPAGLKRIESATFRDCENLKSIELPESIEFIAGNAFGKNIELICKSGSYAEQYAKDNGFEYTIR